MREKGVQYFLREILHILRVCGMGEQIIIIGYLSYTGEIQWNVERWNGTVERWNGIVAWWNVGMMEWATMTNDPVPHHLFARAHYNYAAQIEKNRPGM